MTTSLKEIMFLINMYMPLMRLFLVNEWMGYLFLYKWPCVFLKSKIELPVNIIKCILNRNFKLNYNTRWSLNFHFSWRIDLFYCSNKYHTSHSFSNKFYSVRVRYCEEFLQAAINSNKTTIHLLFIVTNKAIDKVVLKYPQKCAHYTLTNQEFFFVMH